MRSLPTIIMKNEFQLSFRHRFTKDVTRVQFDSYRNAVRYGHFLDRYSDLLDGYTIRLVEFDSIVHCWCPIRVLYHKRWSDLPSMIPHRPFPSPITNLTY